MTMTVSPTRSRKRRCSDDDFYPTRDGKPMAETDKHRNLMFDFINALTLRYADQPDVYVSGNNFVFYQEGDPKKRISPDCYVVFGVAQRERDSFMSWREGGHLPDVVFEFTSRKTRREDIAIKRPLYESVLRVSEYFLFDPTGDYLRPRFQGYRLVEGRYENIPLTESRMRSEQLGLDLVQEGNTLRLFDPIRGIMLPTPLESERRAQQEAQRAQQEAQRAESAEAENARLRAELAALREGRQSP